MTFCVLGYNGTTRQIETRAGGTYKASSAPHPCAWRS
jgi:hypothetical protein